jgi:hypothetical protein
MPWPPPTRYGFSRIRSPAQIASWTASGALAGAYASPWMILAVNPGTVGRGNGSAGWAPTPAPPEVEVAAGDDDAPAGDDDDDAAVGDDVPVALEAPFALVAAPPPVPFALAAGAIASANTAKLGTMRFATRKTLFRGPAGLADGLALKEPAPPAGSPRDSPQRNWVPRSADVEARGFGVAGIYPLTVREEPSPPVDALLFFRKMRISRGASRSAAIDPPPR